MNQVLATGDIDRTMRAHRERFEALYRAHYAFVWRCARRMGVPEEDSEDVIQDVFVTAYRRLDQLDPEVKPSSWLFGILRNVVRNRSRGLRRRARRVQAFAAHVDQRERTRQRSEVELGERVLARDAVEAFLVELDPRQRDVFVLAELEGYTGREIAESLAINPNTVHSRLRLARRAFCRHFELEPKRRVLAAALRPVREQPERPSANAEAHSLGLVFAALASPWRGTSVGAGLVAWLGTKAGVVAATSVAVASVVLVGVSVQARGSSTAEAQPAGIVSAERESSARSQGPAPRFPSVLADASAPVEPSKPVEPLVVQAPAEAPPAKAPHSRAPHNAELDPGEQLRLARAALVAGDPSEALATLARVPAKDGRLLEQRVATEVAAHCKLGQVDAARHALDGLRDRSVSSAFVARLDHACW